MELEDRLWLLHFHRGPSDPPLATMPTQLMMDANAWLVH